MKKVSTSSSKKRLCWNAYWVNKNVQTRKLTDTGCLNQNGNYRITCPSPSNKNMYGVEVILKLRSLMSLFDILVYDERDIHCMQ